MNDKNSVIQMYCNWFNYCEKNVRYFSQNTISMNWNPTEIAWSLVWSRVCLNHNQCSVGKKHTHTHCDVRDVGSEKMAMMQTML